MYGLRFGLMCNMGLLFYKKHYFDVDIYEEEFRRVEELFYHSKKIKFQREMNKMT